MKAKYLIDTNTWIFYFKGKFGVRDRMNQHQGEEYALSEINIAELIYGAYHSRNFNKHMQEVLVLKSAFQVLPISDCLDEYGQIRNHLTKQGVTVENFDLLIAATALHYNLTVVTENLRHFQQIPNLKVENWVDRTK